MKINRCIRCGGFYTSEGDVCPNCITKDNMELSVFKTYLENNVNETSLNNVSIKTGISTPNLNRFLGYEGFEDFEKNFK